MVKILAINDMHVHLRQDDLLTKVGKYSLKNRQHIIAMPNIDPPIIDSERMINYFNEIDKIDSNCKVLRTIALTNFLTVEELKNCKENGLFAVKLYPRGVTNNSHYGLTINELETLKIGFWDIFDEMIKLDIPLLIHAEHPFSNLMDAECDFLRIIQKLLEDFPKLKVTIEHISDARTIDFIKWRRDCKNLIAGSITLHHLIISTNDVFGNPNNYCKPIAKSRSHVHALNGVALRGTPGFFLGSDSAPHPIEKKYNKTVAPGCYTAPILIPMLFDHFYGYSAENDVVKNFEKFCTLNAAEFYNLPIDANRYVILEKQDSVVPDTVEGIVPFNAGSTLAWTLSD